MYDKARKCCERAVGNLSRFFYALEDTWFVRVEVRRHLVDIRGVKKLFHVGVEIFVAVGC